MRSINRYLGFPMIGIALWIWGVLSCQAWAEIRMDGSLGPAGALQGPDYHIRAELGHQAGGNLFHSFEVLNIGSSERATFSGPASVTNVIGRVTGGGSSLIDGNLACTIDGADVYLINPAGVVFGENASLEMTGDFHVSTADYLGLGDQGRFDAIHPENSTLTASPPEAFGFLDGDVAGITINASRNGLWVAEGAALSVVGGDISLQNTSLGTPGGRIHVAAVASAGEFSLEDMDADHFQEMAAVTIADSYLCTSADGGGDIYLRGGELVVVNGHLWAETLGDSDGGVIDLDMAGDCTFSNFSSISGTTCGTGRGSDVLMNVKNLFFADGSAIYLNTYGSGGGGAFTITSEDSVEISEGVYISMSTYGSGNGGDLIINAKGDVTISGTDEMSSIIQSNVGDPEYTWFTGNAGDITITADTLGIDGDVFIDGETYALGQGATLTMMVNDFFLINGGVISVGSVGNTGIGGGVVLRANGDVTISGGRFVDSLEIEGEQTWIRSTLASYVSSYDVKPNSIDISANTLNVLDGGYVFALADAIGDAPDIHINTHEAVNVVGSDASGLGSTIASSTVSMGAAGNISIETGNCLISRSGVLQTVSTGSGNAGDIAIAHADVVEISDGATIATATTGAGGGGVIKIEAADVEISSWVTSSSLGAGDAGRIEINANTLAVFNDGTIDVSSIGSGDGGTIEINTDRLILSKGGDISANVIDASLSETDPAYIPEGTGTGKGGDITITAREFVLLTGLNTNGLSSEDTYVNASTTGSGNGGSIHIETPDLTLAGDAWLVTASGGSGDAGGISIHADNRITLSQHSQINTKAEKANGGDITLIARERLVLQDSKITTTVLGGGGSGGDIQIDPTFVILNNSEITANAYQGNGGNIDIITEHFIKDAASIVDASSQLGIDGDVDIASPDIDFSDISTLSTDFIDTRELNTQRCSARDVGDSSSLIVKGKGRLLPGPENYLTTLVSDMR